MCYAGYKKHDCCWSSLNNCSACSDLVRCLHKRLAFLAGTRCAIVLVDFLLAAMIEWLMLTTTDSSCFTTEECSKHIVLALWLYLSHFIYQLFKNQFSKYQKSKCISCHLNSLISSLTAELQRTVSLISLTTWALTVYQVQNNAVLYRLWTPPRENLWFQAISIK